MLWILQFAFAQTDENIPPVVETSVEIVVPEAPEPETEASLVARMTAAWQAVEEATKSSTREVVLLEMLASDDPFRVATAAELLGFSSSSPEVVSGLESVQANAVGYPQLAAREALRQIAGRRAGAGWGRWLLLPEPLTLPFSISQERAAEMSLPFLPKAYRTCPSPIQKRYSDPRLMKCATVRQASPIPGATPGTNVVLFSLATEKDEQIMVSSVWGNSFNKSETPAFGPKFVSDQRRLVRFLDLGLPEGQAWLEKTVDHDEQKNMAMSYVFEGIKNGQVDTLQQIDFHSSLESDSDEREVEHVMLYPIPLDTVEGTHNLWLATRFALQGEFRDAADRIGQTVLGTIERTVYAPSWDDGKMLLEPIAFWPPNLQK